MAKAKLVLYIDVVSPYVYFAFHVISTSPVFKACDVSYVPVFLGGIMKATGNTPPIKIINKGKYVENERMRFARLFDIPMARELPPGFPRNTVQVQRALTAINLLHPETLVETLATLYHLSWVEGQEIHTFDVLRPVFGRIYGPDRAKVIFEKATSDEVKTLLTTRTSEAFDSGSFGLPWYVATNSIGEKECFWGFNSIGQVADHLGFERPTSGSGSGRGWRAML